MTATLMEASILRLQPASAGSPAGLPTPRGCEQVGDSAGRRAWPPSESARLVRIHRTFAPSTIPAQSAPAGRKAPGRPVASSRPGATSALARPATSETLFSTAAASDRSHCRIARHPSAVARTLRARIGSYLQLDILPRWRIDSSLAGAIFHGKGDCDIGRGRGRISGEASQSRPRQRRGETQLSGPHFAARPGAGARDPAQSGDRRHHLEPDAHCARRPLAGPALFRGKRRGCGGFIDGPVHCAGGSADASPAWRPGDFAAFHAGAKRTDATRWRVGDRRGSVGQMLLNTGQPFGAPLPPTSEGPHLPDARRGEHKTLVSRASIATCSTRWIVSIETATTSEAGGRYTVALVVPVKLRQRPQSLEHSERMARRHHGPDRPLRPKAARSRRHGRRDGVDRLAKRRRRGRRFGIVSREGEPVINANRCLRGQRMDDRRRGEETRTGHAGVASHELVHRPRWQFLASIVLAIMLARWITHSLLSPWSATSADLVRGEPVTFDTNITEFRRLWRALRRTAQGVRKPTPWRSKARRDCAAPAKPRASASTISIRRRRPRSARRACIRSSAQIRPKGCRSPDSWIGSIPPIGETARARMLEVQRRAGPYEFSHRIVGPDGGVRWIVDMGEAIGPIDARTGLSRG